MFEVVDTFSESFKELEECFEVTRGFLLIVSRFSFSVSEVKSIGECGRFPDLRGVEAKNAEIVDCEEDTLGGIRQDNQR